MSDPTTVPNGDLREILSTVRSSMTSNRASVLRRREELVLELEQNKLVEKQFNTLLHGIDLLIADPFALQSVAERLLADEVAALQVAATPPSTDSPQLPAGVADSEGSAAPAAEVPAVTGDVGATAVENAVANDESAAS